MINITKDKVNINGIEYETKYVDIAFPGSTSLPESYSGRTYKSGEFHYFYGPGVQNIHLEKNWFLGEEILKSTKSIDAIVNFYSKKKDSNLDDYIDLRKLEYPTTDELIVALWEHIVEGKSDSIEILQKKRNNIKSKYPKPDIGE
jgi:hypothetical protein